MAQSKNLGEVLHILIPGFRGLEEMTKRDINNFSQKEKKEIIESLFMTFDAVRRINLTYNNEIKEITGHSNWLKKICKDANLVYDDTIASHFGPREALYLKSQKQISIQEMLNKSDNQTLLCTIEAVDSLIRSVYQLEEMVVPA